MTDIQALAANFPELEELLTTLDALSNNAERRQCIVIQGSHAVAADGCTYYAVQGSELSFEIVLSRSLRLGNSAFDTPEVDFPSIRFLHYDGSIDDSSLAARSLAAGEPLHIASVSAELGDAAYRTQGFDRLMDYHTESVLSLPMSVNAEPRGVLQFINATNAAGDVQAFSARQIALATALTELFTNYLD